MTQWAESLRRAVDREIERRQCTDDECRHAAEQQALAEHDLYHRLGIGRLQ